MDRRQALQKLMAGGAVIAGASMVSSSPVFAASSMGGGQPMGPGLTTPPPMGQTANDGRTATWTIAAPEVQCSSGTMQVSSSMFARTLSGDLNVAVASPTGFGFVPGDTATFSAIRFGRGNSPFRRGDSFEVIWSVRYECVVDGAVAGCQVIDYTYRYMNQRNGSNPDWQPVPGTPFVSSTVPCSPP